MKIYFSPAFFILLLHLLSSHVSAQQEPYIQYLDHPWVDSVLSILSREEKIAQSVWVLVGPDDGLIENMEVARSIKDLGLGGLIFTTSPNEQMQELANYCRSYSTIPLAIATEGRWEGQYPNMISLAAIASDSVRYLAGSNLAAGIRKKGVDLIIAESMDDALAAGLSDNFIQVLDPKWVHSARICEIDKYMDLPTS
ncbi:MAG: hypothetical protein E4H10_06945, partial [Bacteroidia bacterium]